MEMLPLNINLNYWILQTLAMLLTTALIPGLFVTSPLGALFAVVGLAFVNCQLWDAALFLQIPDSLSMQTLSLFLANGIIFWVLVKVLPGIEVRGILPALIAPVIFTISSIFISKYLQHVNWAVTYSSFVSWMHGIKGHFLGQTPS